MKHSNQTHQWQSRSLRWTQQASLQHLPAQFPFHAHHWFLRDKLKKIDWKKKHINTSIKLGWSGINKIWSLPSTPTFIHIMILCLRSFSLNISLIPSFLLCRLFQSSIGNCSLLILWALNTLVPVFRTLIPTVNENSILAWLFHWWLPNLFSATVGILAPNGAIDLWRTGVWR